MSNTKFKCPICSVITIDANKLYLHIEEEHGNQIPKNWSVEQYHYYLKTGRENGTCVMCKKPTKWNSDTLKYHRYCTNPKCKEEYRNIFKERMIGSHGTVHLLNDPDQQRKMLANRSISGSYQWSSNSAKLSYTGSYELDFLKMLDVFMSFDSDDIMSPSPHTYYYEYEGDKKFYIPDMYIPSLNLEIEIKDGGDNPNMHHKIQDVDKVKEKLKDAVMMKQPNMSYIKLVNKEYEPFFRFLNIKKEMFMSDEKDRAIYIIDDKPIIVNESVVTPMGVEVILGGIQDYKSTTENVKIVENLTTYICDDSNEEITQLLQDYIGKCGQTKEIPVIESSNTCGFLFNLNVNRKEPKKFDDSTESLHTQIIRKTIKERKGK